MKKRSLYILILLIISSCDEVYEEFSVITLKNNTGKLLYYDIGTIESNIVYPDTLLPNSRDSMKLRPISGNVFTGNKTDWSERINQIPSDTLSIYFFYSDTLDTFNWQEIKSGYKVLKRYDLSLEDLKQIDYKVSFPPTENMINIKQFPE